jgi:hypothetical protein|tara:strand:+ start:1610 stop:2098 length:489 start_codon:yes stop_codon:yes gene_type:complete
MSIFYKGQEIKNVTLNMLYDLFRSVGSSNTIIQTTTIGDIFEVDLVETKYPLLHIGTETATYDTSSLTYTFQFIVMDLVKKDESNEEEVLSDMLQVIGDVLSVLLNSDFDDDFLDFRQVIQIQQNITCEPFTERFDNEVTGWTAGINIVVEFNASACSGYVA